VTAPGAVAPVRFTVDGAEVVGKAGDSVASALLAQGMRILRRGPGGEPRGLFCGIGVCFDCLVTVDGCADRRACLVPIRDGMVVERRLG